MNIVEQLMHVALLGSAWVLYLLFGLSIVSFAAILERVVFFRRNAKGARGLREALDHALAGDDVGDLESALRRFDSIEGETLRAALSFRRGGPEAFLEAVEAQLERGRAKLDRGLNLLGTLGNNAPFVGLFGTVIGVIEAFHHLGAGGANAAGMDNVMAGIAEALIATGVGIFVALPAVVAYNVGQKKSAEVEGETLSLGRLVAAWLRSSPTDTERAAPKAVHAVDESVARLALGEAVRSRSATEAEGAR